MGWWKAPIMFLPSGWLTPVLPPTEESTWAITVVGTCRRAWCPGSEPQFSATAKDCQADHTCAQVHSLYAEWCQHSQLQTQTGLTNNRRSMSTVAKSPDEL